MHTERLGEHIHCSTRTFSRKTKTPVIRYNRKNYMAAHLKATALATTTHFLKMSSARRGTPEYIKYLSEIMELGQKDTDFFVRSLPFSVDDTTAGVENEFQSAVEGSAPYVDLSVTIEESNYYKNLIKRTERGDTSKHTAHALRKILNDTHRRIWEHSWVRFPRTALSEHAIRTLEDDLRADKAIEGGPRRADAHKFFLKKNNEEFIRIPVSYLLKLSLADAISGQPPSHPVITNAGREAMKHFLNDNTSPEIYSFTPSVISPRTGSGTALAHETAIRFLLTQLLVMYANNKFQLSSLDQRVVLYSAPHPPVRQKELNDIISDSFYRELFMNPCLSGWDKGMEKHEYMKVCHRVLSRSQLNAVIKLKEANIITSNLTVVPNISNICLANNSTHISIGSLRLGNLLKDKSSGFTVSDEKYLADLVIKIVEHFLPLFVGTYSAAPYRLDFADFHPEKALGFLPHELDYTHLRMIWRRWKGKANIRILGRPVTPFGPRWLDAIVSNIFGLKGDFVQDFRLIDYFVSIMSTDESPALDGIPGNGDRLKRDLMELGTFDSQLVLYMLYRPREFSKMGFTGFEGRYYSLFERFTEDIGRATDLQTLITALAYKYIFACGIDHCHIPDDPTVESERRQIFFGTAIGIPTFFVHSQSPNKFIQKVLARTKKTRLSHRYANYLRVHNIEYRKALIRTLREDAADLIEVLDMKDTVDDLEYRVCEPEKASVSHRLTNDILQEADASSPFQLSGRTFNLAAETFYRDTLRKRHVDESIDIVGKYFDNLDSETLKENSPYREPIHAILKETGAREFLDSVRQNVVEEKATAYVLNKFIQLTLLVIERFKKSNITEE